MMTGIFGNLSSGKTVFGVMLCKEEQKKGRKIISNIKLNFPSVHLTLDNMFYYATTDSMFYYDSVLFIDEMHNLIDARRASSDLNQKFTQFITQLGKLSCDLLFTSQILSSQIDLRLRELCDVYCFCMRFAKDEKGYHPLLLGERIVKTDILIDIDIIIKVKGGQGYISGKMQFDPKPYYNSYDTREIVLLNRDKYLKR